MSKVVWLKSWIGLGGWWWRVERGPTDATEYHTNLNYKGIWTKVVEDDGSGRWDRTAGPDHVEVPRTHHDMVVWLAREGHDTSALPVGKE